MENELYQHIINGTGITAMAVMAFYLFELRQRLKKTEKKLESYQTNFYKLKNIASKMALIIKDRLHGNGQAAEVVKEFDNWTK